MIKPVLQDEAFIENVQRARGDREHFKLWWLGQSGFLLQWQDHHLLFDPYLSDSLTKKYALTDKPHVRMTERVVAPERLNFIDVVTSSHNHTDHLDAETLIPLLKVNPKIDVIIPEANREFVVNRLQTMTELPIGLDAGKHTIRHGFTIHGVPAAHETIDKDELSRCKYLGYVVEFGGWSVYRAGDTIPYPGLAETLRQWSINVALLPINGSNPERRVAGNLNAREAAELARDIAARCAIPMHYEMFEFNTADPRDFLAAASEQGICAQVLQAGERWTSHELLRKKKSGP